MDSRSGADDAAGKAKREEAIALVRAQGVEAIAQAMVPKLLSPEGARKPDLVERLTRMIKRQRPDAVASDLAAMRDREDRTGLLASIAVPTLVVVGELDALTPPADSQSMVTAIPGARLVTVPGAGHLAPMERPRAVAAALSEFFSGALPRTTA